MTYQIKGYKRYGKEKVTFSINVGADTEAQAREVAQMECGGNAVITKCKAVG